MATNSTPVTVYLASIMTGTGIVQSSSVTATIVNTGAWEIQVPIAIQFSNVSGDPIINIYRSTDAGNSFETTPTTSFSIARVTAGARIGRVSVSLTTGLYALQLLNSGPNSAVFNILTANQITAINNA